MTSIIGAYGYITKEAAEVSGIAQQLITQPESAIEGTRMLVSIYPSIPFLIGCGLLFFYKINKNMEIQIEAELKHRRIQ